MVASELTANTNLGMTIDIGGVGATSAMWSTRASILSVALDRGVEEDGSSLGEACFQVRSQMTANKRM